MGNGVIKIDGKDYNVSVTSLKRSFEVADSDATGRTADWKMHRDVVGTFYNYTLGIAVKNYDFDAYREFYDVISAPVASHTIEVPYGTGTLTFDAYVTKGSDELMRIYHNRSFWKGFSCNFIAMEPQRKA